jgi:TetR/AcrR family transcriptional regulator
MFWYDPRETSVARVLARTSESGVEVKSLVKRSAREALLVAAAELMNERDTLDVSLSEIAARAQLNSALVKYYFGSKSGMMLALIERAVLGPVSELERVVDGNMNVLEKLRIHTAGLINNYFRNRFLNKLLFALLRDSSPPDAQDISDRLVKPAADAQRKILEQGVREGVFREVDPMMFYFTIIGACDQIFTASFALQSVFNYPALDEDLKKRFIDHTVSILLNGVLYEPGSANGARLR